MKFRNLYLLTVILLLVSCNTINYLTIDVKKSAEITIDPRTKRIAVVSNFAPQPETYGHTAYSYNKKGGDPKIATDSLGAIFMRDLVTKLRSMNRFEVLIPNTTIRKSFFDESPLSKAQIYSIVDSTRADLIISIDQYLIESTLKLSLLKAEQVYLVELNGRSNPTLHLYNILTDSIPKMVQMKDTLYWSNWGVDEESAVRNFPILNNCFHDLAFYSSDKVMKKLFPHFEKATRFYYSSSNMNLKDAVNYLKKNKWEEAAEIWSYFYQYTKNKTLKGYCAANLALAAEINDDYETAIEWCDKALELLETVKSSSSDTEQSRIEEYRKELKERLRMAILLDQQL